MTLSATRVKTLKEPGAILRWGRSAPIHQQGGTKVMGPSHYCQRAPTGFWPGRISVRKPGSCSREGVG